MPAKKLSIIQSGSTVFWNQSMKMMYIKKLALDICLYQAALDGLWLELELCTVFIQQFHTVEIVSQQDY